MSEIKKIAILTGGGDCPGLNPVIRAVVKTAIEKYGLEVVGIRNGYHGLYHNDFIKLDLAAVQEIITIGGTILGSSNKDNLFKYPVRDAKNMLVRNEDGSIKYHDVSDIAVENLKEAGIDALFILGGDGTLTSGRDFARKGVNVIGIPKTIDNDLACTDFTFGFDTAISVVTDALDRIRTTGKSHHRVMVAEIMGRGAGWLTLHGGIAGAADVILIPEIPYDIKKVIAKIARDIKNGKDFTVIAAAEGAHPIDGGQFVSDIVETSPDAIRLGGIAKAVAKEIEFALADYEIEARASVLGHIQRGGSPTGHDRVLSTRYGYAAVELAMQGKFGNMVTLSGDKITYAALEDVIGQQTKNVDPDSELIQCARAMGICFGD